MTESAYFANLAQRNAFGALGVEEYEVVTTLDEKTCEVCAPYDGKHFPMSQWEAGITAPIFHPFCRCCTAPYFEDLDGERFARDADGTAYYVPSDMTYPEWKNTFVDGGSKDGLKAVPNAGSGLTSWVKDIPEPPEPVKKEYLTKKKLQENITELDGELADLEAKYGDVLTNGTVDDMQKYVDLQKKKAELQDLLDDKIFKEQKKALTKQQVTLQVEFDQLQGEVKAYSGIWKDDVTTADWKAKSSSIQGKKDYFAQKLTESGLSPDDKLKFEQLLKDLDEFDAQGKQYWEVQRQLEQVQKDLTNLKKGGTIKGDIDNAFTQARKDAALWAKTPQEADDVLRGISGDVWQGATKAERQAIYDYTSGSGGFNRPLRGYRGSWHDYQGVGKVDLDYEGRADAIKQMTALIDKSSYDVDVWLQRGVESASGAAHFLGISENELLNLTESELVQRLVDKEILDEAFVSCGSAKGKGFRGYIFNIYCPKGTKMMYAEPFSHYGTGGKLKWNGKTTQSSFGYEDETIIQRGSKFRISKIEKGGGNFYFDIEVVGQ